MRYFFAIALLVFSIFESHAQREVEISSAKVSFTFVNNDVEGTLMGFTSESIIDLDNIENSKLKGSVDVETINTGNSIRNWSLRRSKYFDADNYPKISFESTSVQQEASRILVKGKLTIKDVTKNINFSFTESEKQLIGKTTIYSSDYGINIKNEQEQNKVLVKLVFQLK
ncbi:MAG: YceI family protein [Maribacter sp.]